MNRFHFRRQGPSMASTIGLGLASAAAGAAIAYFLYGTETGSEKREQVQEWIRDKKDKVMKGAGELGGLAKEMGGDMASLLKEKYGEIKELNQEEISELTDQIRKRWQSARDDIGDIIDGMSEDES